jgi:two-component system cell cycle response regulator
MCPKILTVDDSKAVRIIVKKTFKPYDCEVLEASNGAEGMDMAMREKPQLILLDVTMPVMDGVEMLAKLKEDAQTRDIPVIMLTAESGQEIVVKIAKLGVRDYIVKPFKDEALIEKVIRIIELKAHVEARAAKTIADPCQIFVLEDKEAIINQIQQAVSVHANWQVKGMADPNEAFEYSKSNEVDAFIMSLTLPNEAAYNLFRLLRSNVKTSMTPVLGMALKTAQAEQQQAQKMGFEGFIAKPIDAMDVKEKIYKAMKIDRSSQNFMEENGVLRIQMPQEMSMGFMQDFGPMMQKRIQSAVEAGMGRVHFDMRQMMSFSMDSVKAVMVGTQCCDALAIPYEFMATPQVMEQAKGFQEAAQWKFASMN